MINRKYKFKEGVQIWVEADRVHYTNDNLTDKVAEALIKSNSAYKRFFAEMPAKDALTGKKGKTLNQMNSTELNAEVLKLDGMTDAEFKKVEKLTNKATRKYIRDYKVPAPAKDDKGTGGDESGDKGGEAGGTDNTAGSGTDGDEGDSSSGENTEKE